MTIYDIKYRTQETAPHYFTRKTMRFFGQTLKMFSVRKWSETEYRISAPMFANGRHVGESVRYFDTVTNNLNPKPSEVTE